MRINLSSKYLHNRNKRQVSLELINSQIRTYIEGFRKEFLSEMLSNRLTKVQKNRLGIDIQILPRTLFNL